MLILAMESSAKPASVAVYADGALMGQYFQNSGLTHSRTLLAMVESLMNNLGVSLSEIGLVAVSRGPGSFTGVRIGVSAAKGLAWGLGKPVCGVSTLEAMAYQAPDPGALLCPVMDARRNQVYNALFEWRDGALVRLCEDRAISLADLAEDLRLRLAPAGATAKGDASAGATADGAAPAGATADGDAPAGATADGAAPAVATADGDASAGATADGDAPAAPCLLIGDGAAISYDFLSHAGVACRVAPELLRWQTAYGVALAARSASPVAATDLEPSYLRPSQAERERAAKSQGPGTLAPSP